MIGLPVCTDPSSKILLQPFISDLSKKIYQSFLILTPFFHNNRLQLGPTLQYTLNGKPLCNLAQEQWHHSRHFRSRFNETSIVISYKPSFGYMVINEKKWGIGILPTEDFLMEGVLVSSNNLTSKRFSYPVSTTGRTWHEQLYIFIFKILKSSPAIWQ